MSADNPYLPPALPRLIPAAWLLCVAMAAAAVSQPASAGGPDPVIRPARPVLAEVGKRAGKDLRAFYAARGNRPLWIGRDGQVLGAAIALLRHIETAQLDGLRPRALKPAGLATAIAAANPADPGSLARAEIAISQAYVRYVRALRRVPDPPMLYETPALAPAVPTPFAALKGAAAARTLLAHVQTMGWMHPYYAPLRKALADRSFTAEQQRIIRLNMERVRTLPAITSGRWVLVDVASARLWMQDGATVVGVQKVVVGRPETPTPAIAGFLRYAIVNPYWNLPDDLMASRVTDMALSKGPGFVRASGFQVLAGWDEDAPVLDPATVDWHAVATGRTEVRARQLPGPGNFMGAVKYMFPNDRGIYLHDTPERHLLARTKRFFSNGCVRLEAASAFGRWLLGKPLPRSKKPETRVELPVPVPIFITYLTAAPEGGSIRFQPDVYGRDAHHD